MTGIEAMVSQMQHALPPVSLDPVDYQVIDAIKSGMRRAKIQAVYHVSTNRIANLRKMIGSQS